MKIQHVLSYSGRLTDNPRQGALSGIGNSALHIAGAQAARTPGLAPTWRWTARGREDETDPLH